MASVMTTVRRVVREPQGQRWLAKGDGNGSNSKRDGNEEGDGVEEGDDQSDKESKSNCDEDGGR